MIFSEKEYFFIPYTMWKFTSKNAFQVFHFLLIFCSFLVKFCKKKNQKCVFKVDGQSWCLGLLLKGLLSFFVLIYIFWNIFLKKKMEKMWKKQIFLIFPQKMLKYDYKCGTSTELKNGQKKVHFSFITSLKNFVMVFKKFNDHSIASWCFSPKEVVNFFSFLKSLEETTKTFFCCFLQKWKEVGNFFWAKTSASYTMILKHF